jgi:hypothetical protein
MLHKAMPPASRHAAHAFEFADEATRLAATVQADDLYKLALQRDIPMLFLLASVDPTIWVPITGGSYNPTPTDFDGGSPDTVAFSYTLDGGAPDTVSFAQTVTGGAP